MCHKHGVLTLLNPPHLWALSPTWATLKYVTKCKMTLNPFHGTGLFQFLLKTSRNLWFSEVFQEEV